MEALSLLSIILGFFYFRNDFAQTEMDKVILGLIPSMPNEAIYRHRNHWGYGYAPQFVPAFFLGANQKIRQN
jgi:hypothetical protein